MSTTRRTLLQLAAAGLVAPSLARASHPLARRPAPGDRKLLFVFAKGGWDASYCWAPELLHNPRVDPDPDGEPAEAGGIAFIDAQARPSVAAFFATHGPRACVIQGFEVRSVAHDMCTRLVMTGSADPIGDDWPAVIAGHAQPSLDMPHVLVSGPAYSAEYTSSVVRVGTAGQFSSLLDGSALLEATGAPTGLDPAAQSVVDAYVKDRAAAFEAAVSSSDGLAFAGRYSEALQRLENVSALGDALDFRSGTDLDTQLSTALDCLELGLSRCAMVTHNGFQDLGWDSHGANNIQSDNYEELFAALGTLMEELGSRPGPAGGVLADEVTVVVFSEMGRHPQLNATDGKDHWTFTSAMLVGPGVAGGRVIGGYDDDVFGEPIDLASGEISSSGQRLEAAHFGATLLALAGVEPEAFTGGKGPIEAALE